MLKLLGKILNKFPSFLWDFIPLTKNPGHFYKSLFFIYWDKYCQVLEIEFFGKVKFLYVG